MLINHDRQADLPHLVPPSHRLPLPAAVQATRDRLPGNNKASSPWTTTTIEALRELGGNPALRPRDIAQALNERFPPRPDAVVTPFSRNSVIGKAFREKIKLLGATATRSPEERERDSNRPQRTTRSATPRKASGSRPSRHPSTRIEVPRPPPVPKTNDTMRLRIRAGAAGLEAMHQSLIDRHEADGHDLFANPIMAEIVCPETRELWQSTTIYHPTMVPDKACRYPTAMSRKRRTHLVCGSPTDGKASYCEWHGRLCRSA